MILADYATGRADRNLKRGEPCATGRPGGPGGSCPRSRGVSRGAGGRGRGGRRPSSRPEVLNRQEVLESARTKRTCASSAGLSCRTVSGVTGGSGRHRPNGQTSNDGRAVAWEEPACGIPVSPPCWPGPGRDREGGVPFSVGCDSRATSRAEGESRRRERDLPRRASLHGARSFRVVRRRSPTSARQAAPAQGLRRPAARAV